MVQCRPAVTARAKLGENLLCVSLSNLEIVSPDRTFMPSCLAKSQASSRFLTFGLPGRSGSRRVRAEFIESRPEFDRRQDLGRR